MRHRAAALEQQHREGEARRHAAHARGPAAPEALPEVQRHHLRLRHPLVVLQELGLRLTLPRRLLPVPRRLLPSVNSRLPLPPLLPLLLLRPARAIAPAARVRAADVLAHLV